MTYITKHIAPYVSPHDTVLDLCCGPCNPTRDIKAKFKTGVDINEKALEIAKNYCDTIVRSDVAYIGSLFQDNSYDVVLWLDGIEHLEEEQALFALDAAEGIAKKTIVVFTPTEKAFFDLDDEYLRHKSFFPTEFWQERGYKVQEGFRSGYKGTIVDMVLAVMEK